MENGPIMVFKHCFNYSETIDEYIENQPYANFYHYIKHHGKIGYNGIKNSDIKVYF